jgi:hypothetical protein
MGRCRDDLCRIPGVGEKLAQKLSELGYAKVSELHDENPELMYQRLISLCGKEVDRCVLYVFRCAVYFASNSIHDPEKLKWWYWKDRR